jgi:hypothetical protein
LTPAGPAICELPVHKFEPPVEFPAEVFALPREIFVSGFKYRVPLRLLLNSSFANRTTSSRAELSVFRLNLSLPGLSFIFPGRRIRLPAGGRDNPRILKCSLFDVQLSSVIFGGAFGAASLTKHCAKRHHRWHMRIEHRTMEHFFTFSSAPSTAQRSAV